MKEKHISRKAVFSLIGLGGLIALIFLGGGHLGLFSGVTIEITERGPYSVIGIEYKGPYRRISHKLKSVMTQAKRKNNLDMIGVQCAILYDDPKIVRGQDQRSLVGFIVDTNTSTEITGFAAEEIDRRQVLIASIEGHPSVAFFKSYPRIKRWLRKNNFNVSFPMFEIYREGGKVELEVPIKKIL